MAFLRVLLISIPILVSCKSSEKKYAEESVKSIVPHKPVPALDAAPKRQKLLSLDDVNELAENWLRAQNEGDFAAYSALFADDFRGIRRSGKRTVRLDREGWLIDRKRMFRKKMSVSISQREVSISHKSATLRFTQEWSSGTYRDLGKKVLRISSSDTGLQISGEEMLSSKRLRSLASIPLLSEDLVLLYEDMIVLSNSPEANWGHGKAVLESGALNEHPAHCEDDPPDYEQENSRYFLCAESIPSASYDLFKASQKVSTDILPVELNAWKNKQLTLYTADKACGQSSLADFKLWAEWRTTTERASAAGEQSEDVAITIIEEGNPILSSKLANTCGGKAIFARSSELPSPSLWSIEAASKELRNTAMVKLKSNSEYQQLSEEIAGVFNAPVTPLMQIVKPPNRGANYLLATWQGALNCHEDGAYSVLWRLSEVNGKHSLEELYTDDFAPLSAKAATDITGDGIPEIITADGILAWDATLGEFDRLQSVGFELTNEAPCYCECE